MIVLTPDTLSQIPEQPGLVKPGASLLQLPEKVLQFGTGVLLRGLPDYFIDKANRQGLFNGRVVVVKSTASGGTDAFATQGGLYSLCVRGIENGNPVEEVIINSSISTVLNAATEWNQVLQKVRQPAMQVIISNTTEVGIVYKEEVVTSGVPSSFPGKLLACLLERYRAFEGTEDSGMVIVPAELVPDNGTKLRAIVLQLAQFNQLPAAFINWLAEANHFCNSLVDRIVPGKLPAAEEQAVQHKLGYRDDLMIMAESFRLWAIESKHPRVAEVLSFAAADGGVVLAPDIEKFRELKLRLLNATHTFSCGLAHLAGFITVKQAMQHKSMSAFISNLAFDEIAVSVTSGHITREEAYQFARQVLDRFRNPFIEHQWISITAQFTSKLKMRCVSLLHRFTEVTGHAPEMMSLGVAGWLLFMHTRLVNGRYQGAFNGVQYTVNDDRAERLSRYWEQYQPEGLVAVVLQDQELWGEDLTQIPGLAERVLYHLQLLMREGALEAIYQTQKSALQAS
ncbi:MAG TPA: tagaturonate reductase [Lacibacter sp.]|nr:tagaturonate reductase [Lacibacter sp.]HMO89199.1 tagaturonate reductase [Lacibacter sp.]HMP87915.1 tagaturonate reductase [Lacibacter sp.]